MEPTREDISVASFDGSRLAATMLTRPGTAPRAPGGTPLVLLPGHMKPAATLEPLARVLLAHEDGPAAALLVDYRGRGRSDPRKDAALYTPRAEASDLVSLLDAVNWHHADVVGSARGGLVAFCVTALRPALVQRLVLNDIGPEIDGVGLARLRLAASRRSEPASWAEAGALLRRESGERYPALGETDYEALAHATYADEKGKPRSRVHPSVFEHFASIDADERYPTLWPEFRALRSRPVLLLRAEHSDALADRTVERMRAEHPDLSVETVTGQGHPPLLHLGETPERIARFLA